MSEKQWLLETFSREYGTTRRVVEAYPAAGAEYRPHERSSRAKDLVWTLATGYTALVEYVLGEEAAFTPTLAPAPTSWSATVRGLEDAHARFVKELEETPDGHLQSTIRSRVGPTQEMDVPRSQLLWMLLLDQVHHRGQLSVYLRLAGGKVPSIYGPSADEPW